MGAGLSPEVILVVALIAIGAYVGGEAIKGAKWAGHKAKCGIERVIGKHCEPPHQENE